MKQPQKHFIRSKKYNYLSPRKIQILEDPDCPDVTEAEVRALYTVLRRKNKPDLIAIIQNRYPQYFNVRGRQIILAAGLNPADFIITMTGSSHQVHINGFTEYEWRLLYDPNYAEISASKIKHTITLLRRAGKDDAADLITTKYQYLLAASNLATLQKHGIDASLDYLNLQVDQQKIDGIPIALWRALNDASYVPTTAQLKKWIKQFELDGDDSNAILLMDKYENLLVPINYEPELSLDDANSVFESLLGKAYSRGK